MMFDHLPSERPERWQMMQAFISTWYPPVDGVAGYTEAELQKAEERLGFRLPAALREWYALDSRRDEIWSRQDFVLPLEALEVESDWLPFYIENQGVCRCGISLTDLAADDPPVGTQLLDELTPWRLVSAGLSAFALTLLAYNVRYSSNTAGTASGPVNPLAASVVEENYQRLAVPDFPWWTYTARFYGDTDTVIDLSEEDTNLWITVTARSEPAFQRCMRLLEPTDFRSEWPCSVHRKTGGTSSLIFSHGA